VGVSSLRAFRMKRDGLALTSSSGDVASSLYRSGTVRSSTQERAIERKNQIGIAGNAMQLAIDGYEKSFGLLQRGQLAIRTIENRKGERRVVSAATLIGSNGG
jgi:hypothetical protein